VRPAPFRYRRAATVDEAVAVLAEHAGRARVLAGGQALVQEMNARLAGPDVVVDVAGVPGLDHVVVSDDLVRVGAMCRIAALERHPDLPRALPALAEAAARIAHPAVRNRGTAGGNVAHADPASGLPPVLLACDGEVVLSGAGGERTVAATAFFTGPRTTAAGPDELITELRFRRTGPRSGSAFAEESRRVCGWGLAGACAVVRLDGDRIAELRIGLLGLAPTAVRAGAAERQAVGAATDPDTIAALARACVDDLDAIPDDVHASATLRRSLGRVTARRSLTAALDRAREA
jgi:carbon-monoxide dehydrogenase medium subunit